MQKWALSLVATLLAVPAPAASVQQAVVTLRETFSPDPHFISVRAGGDEPVNSSNDECDYGYIAMSRMVLLDYTSTGASGLYVYAEGDGDIMLFLVPPAGDGICDDDSHEGLNPLVYIPTPQSGLYSVLVGSYSQDALQDATLYFSRTHPNGGSGSVEGTPDLSLGATYGSVSLSAPFSPDPHSVSLSAGGSVDVDVSGCVYGYVARAPDYNFTYSGSGNALYFFVRSDEDTTLLINKPDASWICDDDSLGDSNPVVTIPNAGAGLYNIWVGTYSSEALTPATLYISTKGAK